MMNGLLDVAKVKYSTKINIKLKFEVYSIAYFIQSYIL